ncbi:MAG: virion core protein (lumpy skin disease virus) [Deltaproteobacteria bacterium]|nr:MAG: virion core protein (lumpy skin disease virus) [Deltaproteobacteria bacterium]
MGTDNVFFLEVLEWFDDSGKELAHRIPEKGSGEIKFGAQLTVRESQAAVFYSEGTACDALGPGQHTLTTKNLPILNKILAIPWGLRSPFRAEVYFVNLKTFVNMRWGTRDPVAFRDSELGLVRLRAHGIFDIQVVQPVLFVNSLVGTGASYTAETLESYISEIIVSKLNDLLGEKLDSLLNLPSKYEGLGVELAGRVEEALSRFGLSLKSMFINAVTPPDDVQSAIDERARLGAVSGKLDDLVKMKMAMALEKGAEGGQNMQGGMGMGMGMGVGMMMPGLISPSLPPSQSSSDSGGAASKICPDCGGDVADDARFCHHCGHQILVLRQCGECGKNLPPKAKFCPRCGARAGEGLKPVFCTACGAENLADSSFCNQCGEPVKG